MYRTPDYFIGKIVKVRFSYFDINTKKNRFKSRPMLVIGVEKDTLPCDFNVLPVSSINSSENVSKKFDRKVSGDDCVTLSLTRDPSYIRTHKQSFTNSKEVDVNIICDLKHLLPNLYSELEELHSDYSATLFK